MQITSEPLEPQQTVLTIEVPPKRIERAMREVAQEFARHERIQGYRPGKVPLSRVIALVGEEPLREAAVEQLTDQVVNEAVRSEEIQPSAPVSVEVTSQDPLVLRAVVPLQPAVDLGDYRSLRVERDVRDPIDDTDVDATLERWRADLAALETVDRPAEADDIVTLALVGRDGDDIVFDDEALVLTLGEDGASESNLPPEVVDEIIGLSAGEDHEFSITYSEFWPQQELQGHEVAFEAHVDGVSALSAPELDDAFAQEVSGAESLDALRAQILSQLQSREEMQARDAHVEMVIEALVDGAEVSFPPAMLEAEVAGMLADLRQRVESQGFTWERWLELQEKDQDALWAEAEPEAEERLKRRIVLSEFVQAEEIDVTRAEINAEVQRITESLPRAARRGMPGVDEMRRSTGSRILSGRAIARLMAIADGELESADAEAEADDGDTEPDAETAVVATDPGV